MAPTTPITYQGASIPLDSEILTARRIPTIQPPASIPLDSEILMAHRIPTIQKPARGSMVNATPPLMRTIKRDLLPLPRPPRFGIPTAAPAQTTPATPAAQTRPARPCILPLPLIQAVSALQKPQALPKRTPPPAHPCILPLPPIQAASALPRLLPQPPLPSAVPTGIAGDPMTKED